MSKVAIVDYGLCNIDSVARAVEECGGNACITNREEDLEVATHIILPGVGAFGDAMHNLKQLHLDEALTEQVIEKQIPFLGICLGMQLMSTIGWEHGHFSGLGWINADVKRFEPRDGERVPHIGWNEVHFDEQQTLFKGIKPGSDFYFVHSYHVDCHHDADVVARTPYCGSFTSAVHREGMYGVQFHPEKSQRVGFQLLRNFLKL